MEILSIYVMHEIWLLVEFHTIEVFNVETYMKKHLLYNTNLSIVKVIPYGHKSLLEAN